MTIREEQLTSRLLGVICLVLLGGILYAGLTPFHSPANQVTWVRNLNALQFGESGTILSSGSFPSRSSDNGQSLEIWMQPGLIEDSNTIVAFYDPAQPRYFSLNQSVSDLELSIESSSAWRRSTNARLYVNSAFRGGNSLFWTVVFGPSGTAIYRDSAIVIEAPNFRLSSQEFSGRLIVGNSPISNQSWSGVLRGLAIYNGRLTAAQIAHHYDTWTKMARPDVTAEDACVALYLFDERAGGIVHSKVGTATDLYIPAKYMVLNQTVLDPVWRAFNWHSGFWSDALINVAGFVPVGFFFCAYFSARGFGRPALVSSALGAAISLMIELVQSHLPTRDSSMSDLINNITGSVVGSVLYRQSIGRWADRCISWVVHLAAGRPD